MNGLLILISKPACFLHRVEEEETGDNFCGHLRVGVQEQKWCRAKRSAIEGLKERNAGAEKRDIMNESVNFLLRMGEEAGETELMLVLKKGTMCNI